MEAALEARAAMTDEDEELKGDDGSVDMERDLKRLDVDGDATEEDDDVGMTEEEDEEDEDANANKTTKSPSKGKKKAMRMNTDDEGDFDDEDEEMKDDTADEDEEEPEDDEEEDDEEEEDDANANKAVGAEASKIDLSDPKSMVRMIRSLPEEEARRHEQFRRAHFDRGAVKRIMAKTIQECSPADRKMPTVSQVMVIIMAGITKSFVGEITAEARRIMDKNGETGPIEPHHLREAQRKYYKRRPLARGRNRQRLLR